MDLSDSATYHEELMRDLALRMAANHAPDLPAVGVCHWCESSLPDGHRFCDKDCRDMYDRQARMDKIRGRVGA